MAVVEVVTAEQSQQELIDRARGALSGSAWVVGECASLFCEKKGCTLQAFADSIDTPMQTVAFYRQVWERFGSPRGDSPKEVADTHIRNEWPHLSFSHFKAAITWDDARKWLVSAAKHHWGVARMVEERERSIVPEDQPTDSIAETAASPTVKQVATTSNTETPSAVENSSDPDPPPAAPTTSKRTAEKKPQLEPAVATPVDHAELLTNRFRAVVDAMASFIEVAAAGELETAREMLAAQFPGLFEVSRPKPARFKPPTVDEVEAFCNSKGIKHFDANRFCNHYGMKGWVVGRSPMKDWKRAVLGALEWCTSSKKKPPGAVAVPAGKYDFIDEACR